jgi:C4-dicarboxylate-specific signal transduction histidine kinase
LWYFTVGIAGEVHAGSLSLNYGRVRGAQVVEFTHTKACRQYHEKKRQKTEDYISELQAQVSQWANIPKNLTVCLHYVHLGSEMKYKV